MHVLLMLFSSCLSRYAQVNKYEDCYDVCDKLWPGLEVCKFL